MDRAYFLTSDYMTMSCVFLQTVRSVLDAEDSSLTQYRILKWLYQHDELTSGELAARSRYSPATVSKELFKLGKGGFAVARSDADRRYSFWRLTGEGLSLFRNLDNVANGVVDAMLSLLTPELRGVFESSCISTSIEVDRLATRGLGYDFHSACLETMFEVELKYIESLHNTGLGITSFRVLLELRTNPGTTASGLCERLMLRKSTVSEALRGLLGAGLVEKGVNVLDKRSRRLFLTVRGSSACEKRLARIDDALTKEIRRTDRRELSSWQELCTMFVVKYRKSEGEWTIRW